MTAQGEWIRRLGVWAVALAALAVVAGAAAASSSLVVDPVGADAVPAPPWRVVGLPRQDPPLTRYRVVESAGERVLEIDAQGSYGNLVHELAADVDARQLTWQWRVVLDNPRTDLRSKAGDDHVVAVCLLYDLPIQAVPFWERQMLRLARAMSREALPAATLCYGWDARQGAGTVLDSPYTRRVRWLVLRGAHDEIGAWRAEQRDLLADFVQLFGDESAQLPPLRAVLIAGDADNTQGRSLAQLKGLVLR